MGRKILILLQKFYFVPELQQIIKDFRFIQTEYFYSDTEYKCLEFLLETVRSQ